jgi:predicted Ser/Thr protein kinase
VVWDNLNEATMIDFRRAKILSHQKNIQRCTALLDTKLNELERRYLHKRIAEEQVELQRLQDGQPAKRDQSPP